MKTLQEIQYLIEKQEQMRSTINKTYLFSADRLRKVSEVLWDINSHYAEEPELWDIINTAFGENSAYHAWVMTLPTAVRSKYTVSLGHHPERNDFVSGKTIGPKLNLEIGEFSTQSIDDLPAYASTSYLKKTKSDWLNHLETIDDTSNECNIARIIENLIQSEHSIECTSMTARVILADYLHDPRLKSSDKQLINTYLHALNAHQATLRELNLPSILEPRDQLLTTVLEKLNNVMNSPAFIRSQQYLEDLYPCIQKINTLHEKYPNLNNPTPYTSVLYEQIQQYPAMLDDLSTALAKAGIPSESTLATLHAAKLREASLNACIDLDTLLATHAINSEQREFTALQALMNSTQYTSTQYADEGELQTPLLTQQRSTYLEHLLTEAFPNLFSRQLGEHRFIVNADLPHKETIEKALGINHNVPTPSPINPFAFSVRDLNRMIEDDPNNAL